MTSLDDIRLLNTLPFLQHPTLRRFILRYVMLRLINRLMVAETEVIEKPAKTADEKEKKLVIPPEIMTQHLEPFLQLLNTKHITVVVFDMDLTIISLHSRGAILPSRLSQFQKAFVDPAKYLISFLLENKIQVAIASMTDEYYYDTCEVEPVTGALAGADLIKRLLETFLSAEDINKIKLVCLNPDLYDSSSQAKQFFHKKMASYGAKESDAAWHYPPLPLKKHHLTVLKLMLKKEDCKEMLLVDDKLENIETAVDGMGAHGIWVEAVGGIDGLALTHLKRIFSTIADLKQLDDGVYLRGIRKEEATNRFNGNHTYYVVDSNKYGKQGCLTYSKNDGKAHVHRQILWEGNKCTLDESRNPATFCVTFRLLYLRALALDCA